MEDLTSPERNVPPAGCQSSHFLDGRVVSEELAAMLDARRHAVEGSPGITIEIPPLRLMDQQLRAISGTLQKVRPKQDNGELHPELESSDQEIATPVKALAAQFQNCAMSHSASNCSSSSRCSREQEATSMMFSCSHEVEAGLTTPGFKVMTLAMHPMTHKNLEEWEEVSCSDQSRQQQAESGWRHTSTEPLAGMEGEAPIVQFKSPRLQVPMEERLGAWSPRSFQMEKKVKVTFMVPGEKPRTVEHTPPPDYGTLRLAVMELVKDPRRFDVATGIYMDGQQLNNMNTRPLLEELIEQCPKADAVHVVLEVKFEDQDAPPEWNCNDGMSTPSVSLGSTPSFVPTAPWLAEQVHNFFRSHNISMEQARLFAAHADFRRFCDGQKLKEQGSAGDQLLHFILAGVCDVYIDGMCVTELGSGSVVGEINLNKSMSSYANVIARGRVDCFSIPSAEIQALTQREPELATVVFNIFTKVVAKIFRLTPEGQFMHEFREHLSREHVRLLVQAPRGMWHAHFTKGTMLQCESGDGADRVTFVFSGRCEVTAGGVHLDTLGPGDICGGAGSLASGLALPPHSVVASTDVEAWCILHSRLRQICEESEPSLLSSIQSMYGRVSARLAAVQQRPVHFPVLPVSVGMLMPQSSSASARPQSPPASTRPPLRCSPFGSSPVSARRGGSPASARTFRTATPSQPRGMVRSVSACATTNVDPISDGGPPPEPQSPQLTPRGLKSSAPDAGSPKLMPQSPKQQPRPFQPPPSPMRTQASLPALYPMQMQPPSGLRATSPRCVPAPQHFVQAQSPMKSATPLGISCGASCSVTCAAPMAAPTGAVPPAAVVYCPQSMRARHSMQPRPQPLLGHPNPGLGLAFVDHRQVRPMYNVRGAPEHKGMYRSVD